jgi:Mn-dependent DtxR family transcriptional regulator
LFRAFVFVKAFIVLLSNSVCEATILKEEQIKILTIMSQATNRMDLNMFAQKVDLDTNQTMANVQELAKKGYVRKVGSGYGLTEKAKAAIKAFTSVSEEKSFHFYSQIGYPTVYEAKSLANFYRLIEQIGVDVIEFHMGRGDFENWLREVFGDEKLADEFGRIKNANLKGEALRKEILKVIEAKYKING